MSWRSYYSAPTTPTVTKSNAAQKEPAWVSVLPAAKGLWNMIISFRERGSHDIADKLEAAAEKQAEAHLRTQELMNKRTGRLKPPTIHVQSNPSPVISQTPVLKAVEIEKSPEDTPHRKTSDTSRESEEVREKEDCEEFARRSRQTRRINPSVRLEPPSPLSSCAVSPRSLSPRSLSPASPTSPTSPTFPPQGDHFLNASPPAKKPHACYHSRLKTYDRSKFRWNSPSPSELSEAGFYFIGPRDNVQCFSCDTCQNYWKPAEDPWVRHTRRSPSCDYIVETRGADFIAAIINKVEKVKNGLMNSYSRTNSSSSLKGADSELSQMKLRETRTGASSGWGLDPYTERGVGAVATKSIAKKKKKS